MGNCCLEAPQEHREIEEQLGKEHKENKSVLLLGAGGSGKSTLLKQMLFLYKFGYDLCKGLKILPRGDSYLYVFCFSVAQNVFEISRAVCPHNDEDVEAASSFVQKYDAKDEIKSDSKLMEAIKKLWEDKTFREMFEQSKKGSSYDNCEYFVNELTRMLSSDYQPTFEDILRSRVTFKQTEHCNTGTNCSGKNNANNKINKQKATTTGVIKQEFVYERDRGASAKYLIIDVGGKPFLRVPFSFFFIVHAKKKKKAREVSAINGLANPTANKMKEEMELFRSTGKHPVFEKIDFIVLLNKHDQFIEKIKEFPFDFSFENHSYTGKQDPDEIIEWIKDVLHSIDKRSRLYFHVTTATGL
ncbi:hypothetical protein RFI_10166 [Reticulomyxa filosa]|uniref:Uncharacterized protein n=1 Tax=Reticulomyxa filosa TaxID=46433 RepID=X6NM32_RETFI|nr:hypothetical protein RFI_10166 [Reticulomyxa filosa]|eukprot:ETO26968.1 hypothetical protein RFI_10166 [Reticulomyxa filosa]